MKGNRDLDSSRYSVCTVSSSTKNIDPLFHLSSFHHLQVSHSTFSGNKTFSTHPLVTSPRNTEIFTKYGKETSSEPCSEQYQTLWARTPDSSLSSTTATMSSFNLMSNEAPDYTFVLFTESEMQSMDAQIHTMHHSIDRRAKPLAISEFIGVCDRFNYGKGSEEADESVVTCRRKWKKDGTDVVDGHRQKVVWDSSTNRWMKATAKVNAWEMVSWDPDTLIKPTQTAQSAPFEGGLKWISNSPKVFWITFPTVISVVTVLGVLAFLYKDILPKKFTKKQAIAL
jgi:hypothetical protein